MSQDPPQRPGFAETIIEKFVSAQSNVFLVYGNARDLYPVEEDRYVPLVDFLLESLINTRRHSPRIAVRYDPAEGLSFVNPADRLLLARVVGERNLERVITEAMTDMTTACAALREFTRQDVMIADPAEPSATVRKDFAIIMEYAEALAPASRGDIMLDGDRLKVITLEDWFLDSSFVSGTDIVFLIAETLTGVNERIVDLPYVSTIKIDRPTQNERQRYIEHLVRQEQVALPVGPALLAYASAGLTLLSIRQIFRQAGFRGQGLTPELIREKTREIIEKELEGHIEFPKLDYGFEKVIGASRLIRKLNELKACLAGDDPDLMPVGILVPGANGVGKTFIYKAFAKECQWVAVILKNIRGPYVGQTEKNWERIRSVLEAMGSVMVLYDEADTEIGGRGPQTHEVDRRLFGNILKMMSDPDNRGKIVWIIITARPDRLEPDIKRSGRAGEHLPVFDNEGEEREAFLRYTLGLAGIDVDSFPADIRSEFLDRTADYYPADFDQLLTALKRRRLLEGTLSPEKVLREVDDFMPSDIARQREYQELLAVLECTSRDLLPARYRDVPRDEIRRRVLEIKSSLGWGNI